MTQENRIDWHKLGMMLATDPEAQRNIGNLLQVMLNQKKRLEKEGEVVSKNIKKLTQKEVDIWFDLAKGKYKR